MKSFFTNKMNLAIIGIFVVIIIAIGITTAINKTSSMSDQTAKAGDHVFVHYVGTFEDGKKFDSSIDRGVPIDFILGQHQVIQGWDDGIVGMKIGEKKHLIISADKGYGSQGVKDGQGNVIIPGNATLIFDVELVSIDR